MKVAGFTIIRNAVLYDYPIVEAITSVLPLCDLFIVAIGSSDDDTVGLIAGIDDPKIRIVHTEWDPNLRAGGAVLAAETNKAMDAIPDDFDWCFYIQADEVIHESDYPGIREAMARELERDQVEGLLFAYRHFYGSYDYIGASRRWYRHEVRIIRNNKKIRSFRDAQGFRMEGKRKLNVVDCGATVYHYGWVKSPEAQQRKQLSFNKLWHNDDAVKAMISDTENYIYDGKLPLIRFTGAHPAVMQARVRAVNWKFSGNPELAEWPLKECLSDWVFRMTGWIPGEYKNYRKIK